MFAMPLVQLLAAPSSPSVQIGVEIQLLHGRILLGLLATIMSIEAASK